MSMHINSPDLPGGSGHTESIRKVQKKGHMLLALYCLKSLMH